MKNLLITLLFLFMINLTFSQTEKGLGIRAGATMSKLTNAKMDYKTNVYFGLFYQMRFNDLYALQPELGYANQGGKNQDGTNQYVEYITIGATNKLFLSPNLGIFLSVTPGFDFDIDDTLIGLINRGENSGNEATFIDFTVSFGFGFELKNGLAFEARYKHGFVDVYSGTFHSFDSELYESENQFNAAFQLGIAYKFNLSKK